MKNRLIPPLVLAAAVSIAGCGASGSTTGSTTSRAAGSTAAQQASTGSGTAATTGAATGDSGTTTAASTVTGASRGTPAAGSRTRMVAELPGGATIAYTLVLPRAYAPGERFPVLVAFPPGGQGQQEVDALLDTWWASEALRRCWIVVSPVAPGGGLFFGASAARIPAFLDHIAAAYPPEGRKFHVAGVSNGGLSAFRAAIDSPARFSSLLVAPGFPPEAGDAVKLGRLKKIRVAMYVGSEDAGWREPSARTAARLRRLGGSATLTVSPGEGHILTKVTARELYDALDATR